MRVTSPPSALGFVPAAAARPRRAAARRGLKQRSSTRVSGDVSIGPGASHAGRAAPAASATRDGTVAVPDGQAGAAAFSVAGPITTAGAPGPLAPGTPPRNPRRPKEMRTPPRRARAERAAGSGPRRPAAVPSGRPTTASTIAPRAPQAALARVSAGPVGQRAGARGGRRARLGAEGLGRGPSARNSHRGLERRSSRSVNQRPMAAAASRARRPPTRQRPGTCARPSAVSRATASTAFALVNAIQSYAVEAARPPRRRARGPRAGSRSCDRAAPPRPGAPSRGHRRPPARAPLRLAGAPSTRQPRADRSRPHQLPGAPREQVRGQRAARSPARRPRALGPQDRRAVRRAPRTRAGCKRRGRPVGVRPQRNVAAAASTPPGTRARRVTARAVARVIERRRRGRADVRVVRAGIRGRSRPGRARAESPRDRAPPWPRPRGPGGRGPRWPAGSRRTSRRAAGGCACPRCRAGPRTSRSGRRALTCARRRRLVVPTRAPAGRASSGACPSSRAARRAGRRAPGTRSRREAVREQGGHVLQAVHGEVHLAAPAAPPRSPSGRRPCRRRSPAGGPSTRSPVVVMLSDARPRGRARRSRP